MRINLFLIMLVLVLRVYPQDGTTELKVGDQAPSFVLNVQQNSIQSFNMPYLNRIVLLHFWSTNVAKSKANNKHLNRIAGRYKNALYRNAEGFEVIAVAVQSDKTAWNASIKEDTLNNFIHGVAFRGYNDEICKKYGVNKVPTDILVDHTGKIIAVNPRIRDLENILDEKKNFMPVKKDVVGTLALSSNPSDLLKYGKLYLFDGYGDSLSQTSTNMNGGFTFSEIKLNQDFILKVDNQSDIITSDPLALYSVRGEKIMDGKTMQGGFVFYIPSKISNMLTDGDHSTLGGAIGRIDVIKELVFKNGGAELTPKDEMDLNAIFLILSKNKSLSVDIVTHTDSKLGDQASMDLAAKQCNTIKNYFLKKGIASTRLKLSPKGKSSPRKKCQGACTEEDHKANRRTEFVVYKN